MALAKVAICAVSITAAAIGCSCNEPPNLCERLEPNMVAFVGRPVTTVHLGKWQARTTFQIEERLWGLPKLDLISVEGTRFSAADQQKSWFVLAGRRADRGPGGDGVFFVSSACCPYGLVLAENHAWVKEFRDNVAQRKSAVMDVGIQSNWVKLPNFGLQLNGPGYAWQGSTGEPAIRLRLSPGDYTVGIEKAYFSLPESSRRASILPGACRAWSISADPVSSISGMIVDFRGQARTGLQYSLTGEVDSSLWDSPIATLRRAWHAMVGWGGPPIERTHYVVKPDQDGQFRLHVLPGKYRLSVVSGDSHSYVFPPPIPRTYYPGVVDVAGASEIAVPPGGDVGNLRFRFPDYGKTRRVDVVVVYEDGSPASNKVVAHTGRIPGRRFRTAGWTQKLTDSQGRATFDVWESLDYDLHVSASVSGDPPHVPAGSAPVSRRFVVERQRPFGQR